MHNDVKSFAIYIICTILIVLLLVEPFFLTAVIVYVCTYLFANQLQGLCFLLKVAFTGGQVLFHWHIAAGEECSWIGACMLPSIYTCSTCSHMYFHAIVVKIANSCTTPGSWACTLWPIHGGIKGTFWPWAFISYYIAQLRSRSFTC